VHSTETTKVKASLTCFNFIKLKAQQQAAGPKAKTEEELAEEEQLQLALAISQSEAEAKEMESRKRGTSAQVYSFPQDTSTGNSDRSGEKGSPQKTVESEDPELARYLNRGYWENRSKDENSKEETGGSVVNKSTSFTDKSVVSKNATAASGWNATNYSFMPSAPFKENKDKGEHAEEIDTFVENLRGQIEIFVNRMKSNSSRGRPIAYDTSVQGLFMNITALHSQLLNFIQIQDNSRSMLKCSE
jgi:growth factor-regulated tyrosine kinase substrate